MISFTSATKKKPAYKKEKKKRRREIDRERWRERERERQNENHCALLPINIFTSGHHSSTSSMCADCHLWGW